MDSWESGEGTSIGSINYMLHNSNKNRKHFLRSLIIGILSPCQDFPFFDTWFGNSVSHYRYHTVYVRWLPDSFEMMESLLGITYSLYRGHFFDFVKMVGFGPHVCDYQKFCWIIKIINKIFWRLLLLCSSCIYHVMCVGVHEQVIVLNADSLIIDLPSQRKFVRQKFDCLGFLILNGLWFLSYV